MVKPVSATVPVIDPHVAVFTDVSGTPAPVTFQGPDATTDPVAITAYENGVKVDQFYRHDFHRNGWDGKGGQWQFVVHTPGDSGKPLDNAFWNLDTHRIYLGDGDGKIFAPLGGSLDVMTHEATHAVVDASVKLPYKGESGAVNESWADVMGSLNEPSDNWKIGREVFTPGHPGDEIRDLAHPRYPTVQSLPADKSTVDVHDLSGIPSLAAVKVADKIGRNEMGKIWYRALTTYMQPNSGFPGAARATLESATSLYGASSTEFGAVNDAWHAVGVDPRYHGMPATLPSHPKVA